MAIGRSDSSIASRVERSATVRHVDHQADPVHFLDHLFAEAGDARVFRLIAAGRQQALIVVGELHEAGAQLVNDFHQADVVFYGCAILKPEKDRRLAQSRARRTSSAVRPGMILSPCT